jgi:hypothetical protein
MENKVLEGRRNFLKASAMSAAGLMVVGSGAQKDFAAGTTQAWKNGMQINPAIDNMRVVYVVDKGMTNSNNWGNWSASQASINTSAVALNVDKLAMALARKSTPLEAWNAIFQKPAAKTWDQVKVALKVNAFADLHPSVAVVDKVCRALMSIGVSPANIRIYDGGGNPGMYNDFIGKADFKDGLGKVVIGNPPGASGGNYDETTITIADANGSAQMIYMTFLDNIDLIVSIAVCKDHDQFPLSHTTMSLKNHTGSIRKAVGSRCPTDFPTELLAYNKSTVVLGNPGPGVPPRQQLAIVDGIFSAKYTTWYGTVDCPPPGVITMGTLAGPVDYLTAYKIRVGLLGLSMQTNAGTAGGMNVDMVNKFVTEFGYTAAEATALLTMDPAADPQGRGWVNALSTVAALPSQRQQGPQQPTIEFSATGGGITAGIVRMPFDKTDRVQSVKVYSMQGRLVRTIAAPSPGISHIVWDGRTDAGGMTGVGTYVVKITGGFSQATGKITLSR